MSKIVQLVGRAMYFKGENIDTDQIIPKDYLKTVKAYGFEDAAFANQREECRQKGEVHPFDDPRNQGASILVTDTNFACGSSREHAVWCLRDWGIKVIVSCVKSGSPGFADIFRGNAAANGLPCVELKPFDHADLIKMITGHPATKVTVDLEDLFIDLVDSDDGHGIGSVRFTMREDHRKSMIEGTWDTINVLIEAGSMIEETANRLPYMNQACLQT